MDGTVVLWGAMIAWLGAAVIPFLIIQGIYGFSLLEVVNYVENVRLSVKVPNGVMNAARASLVERYVVCPPTMAPVPVVSSPDRSRQPEQLSVVCASALKSTASVYGYASMIVWAYVPYFVAASHGPSRTESLWR